MVRISSFVRNDLKFNFTGETLIAIITIFIMWAGYYIDNHGFFEGNLIWEVGIWGIGVIIIMNVCFPAWWIVKIKGEGFAGMGITTKRLGLALLLGILLGGWRFIELIPYLNDAGLVRVVIFNLLSIWEACFLFGWLFTRFTKAFGKIAAVILTAVGEGIYHIGTYPSDKIIYLVLCLCICGICFATTDNIFTVWPIYWISGCSASVMKGYGSEIITWELVVLMGAVLIIQLLYLTILAIRMKKSKNKTSKMVMAV